MEGERRGSAEALIGDLVRLKAGGPLLDVGCSFGWLLEMAERAGLEAYGVDPSESAVAAAHARGLRVRRGHFPEEDWGRRDWAVITYMDVLEHIRDLDFALARTVERLRPGGFLGIQVPVSTGAVFRAAAVLEHASLGRIDQPLRRLLQIEFPYPHLHYFNRGSLEELLRRFGMEVIAIRFHPIAAGNLVDRVSWRKKASPVERAEAACLKLLLTAGRLTGRNDLLRLIARRPL
jgi:SAM-dependent methyltransferase